MGTVIEKIDVPPIQEHLDAKSLRSQFGTKSSFYSTALREFTLLWKDVEAEIKPEFDQWRENLMIVYGCEPGHELFMTHTYLVNLVKLIAYFNLRKDSSRVEQDEIIDVVNGGYFRSYGISNFTEEDFAIWLLHPKVVRRSSELLFELGKGLLNYDISHVSEDLFKGIYEEAIPRGERHKAGEYYTPEWLVQLMLSEALQLWRGENSKLPRMLDPACGSGSFLYNAIRLIKENLQHKDMTNEGITNFIIRNIVGMDVNPIASIIARANYLLALGDLVQKGKPFIIPVHTADSLKPAQSNLGIFDILIGNPPWISMRSIQNNAYQDLLKNEALRYRLLNHKDVHLFTQMEMATLVFCKCSDLYLKNRGIAAFVMPRSVLAGTLHHVAFRSFSAPEMKLMEIFDLENVSPLFNMPSCVLFALKGEKTKYPVLARKYKGEFPENNMALGETKGLLSVTDYMYKPPSLSETNTYYFDKFRVGASIFPRAFYFVDFLLAADIVLPLPVKTSTEIQRIVKSPWKIEVRGKVEPHFIYYTLLAWEIIPFGYIKLRPVVLPIEPAGTTYKLFNVEDLGKGGSVHMAEWLRESQRVWEERRTAKSENRFASLNDRLNYNGLLSVQDPSKRHVVIYNATGTNIVSCVIDKQSLLYLDTTKTKIRPVGFIADVKTWFYETNDQLEAHYLCAILNSDVLNKAIKPLQPRGLFGPRAIHRRPLFFPIPKFDENNELHSALVKISSYCHEEIAHLKPQKTPKLKEKLGQIFGSEAKEINDIVPKLLNSKLLD